MRSTYGDREFLLNGEIIALEDCKPIFQSGRYQARCRNDGELKIFEYNNDWIASLKWWSNDYGDMDYMQINGRNNILAVAQRMDLLYALKQVI